MFTNTHIARELALVRQRELIADAEAIRAGHRRNPRHRAAGHHAGGGSRRARHAGTPCLAARCGA